MNKVALIIGSGGIGTATAQKMVQKGIKVYSSYYDEKPNTAGINFFNVDVTSIDSIKEAFSRIILAEKKVDSNAIFLLNISFVSRYKAIVERAPNIIESNLLLISVIPNIL